MTVLSIESSAEDTLASKKARTEEPENEDLCLDTPAWVEEEERRVAWGTPLSVLEWDDHDSYRSKNGWQGRDLVHDVHSPVRILEYWVKYGEGLEPNGTAGGVGTTLTGIAHFTKRAESHKGYCHGGSMCSLMDDIIGWCGFVTTGKCIPWSGFTVQINTALQKPIQVNSYLLIQAKITKLERRKVSIEATLLDPAAATTDNNSVHAKGEGLVILNKGVLPPHLEL